MLLVFTSVVRNVEYVNCSDTLQSAFAEPLPQTEMFDGEKGNYKKFSFCLNDYTKFIG